MDDLSTVRGEIVSKIYFVIELNHSDAVRRRESVYESGGRLPDNFTKTQGGSAHIEHYHNAEWSLAAFEFRYILFDPVFEKFEILTVQIYDRASALIYHAHVQTDERRIDTDRVVILCIDV
jgi:hypothetical protein